MFIYFCLNFQHNFSVLAVSHDPSKFIIYDDVVQETFLITVLSMLKSVLLPNIFVENVFFPHYLFIYLFIFSFINGAISLNYHGASQITLITYIQTLKK